MLITVKEENKFTYTAERETKKETSHAERPKRKNVRNQKSYRSRVEVDEGNIKKN